MNLPRVKQDPGPKTSWLEIRAFRTPVHLGVSEEERAFTQEVEFDVRMEFAEVPLAAQTDRIEDTISYALVCEAIDRTARAHPFHLIEALGAEAYRALRQIIPQPTTRLLVTVHKLHPPIENLRGGALFTFGDA